jgi:hypothetical protein
VVAPSPRVKEFLGALAGLKREHVAHVVKSQDKPRRSGGAAPMV